MAKVKSSAAKAKPKRRSSGSATGGKSFEPTPEQRQLVQNLSGFGLPQDRILQAIPWGTNDGLPITKPTLHKHFRAELDRGIALANMRAMKALHEMIAEKSLGAICFYLKTQCGWKETVAVESSGPNGAPLPAGPIFYLPAKDAPQGTPADAAPPGE